jgi:hypothetical protein
MDKQARAFFTKYYAQLKGAKIIETGIGPDEEYGPGFPYLMVELANGEKAKLEISQDEEGNGPGFLFGLPLPEVKNAKPEAASGLL